MLKSILNARPFMSRPAGEGDHGDAARASAPVAAAGSSASGAVAPGGLPPRRSPATLRPGIDPTNPQRLTRNDSGPLADGRTPLRFLQPPRERFPVLVYDQHPPQDEGHMTMFRHTGDLSRLPATVNTRGLAGLRLSGSERIMSEAQVLRIREAAGAGPLTVVDLRVESHAVAAGYPVTWRGRDSWVNVGLRLDEAVQQEARLVEEMNGRVALTLEHAEYVKGRTADPQRVHLGLVKLRTEQEVVEAAGARYHRLGVVDHLRPGREAVDGFVELARSLPPDAALHVHCNGGMGRTTTFMVLYDMLRNARDVNLEDILQRQSILGYDYPLTDFSQTNHPDRIPYKEDRLAFLREFHVYARENPDGWPLRWSQWRSGVTPAGEPAAGTGG
jgi:hypothetical protein